MGSKLWAITLVCNLISTTSLKVSDRNVTLPRDGCDGFGGPDGHRPAVVDSQIMGEDLDKKAHAFGRSTPITLFHFHDLTTHRTHQV